MPVTKKGQGSFTPPVPDKTKRKPQSAAQKKPATRTCIAPHMRG